MNIREILSDPAYPALKDYILNHTGLAYYADKDEDFATRIARRFAACQVSGCAQYLDILTGASGKTAEINAAVGELTIGETYFFRQGEHFDQLRSIILPDLIERNRESRRLRIWSAGCATGAEPYSISMLLHLEFAARLRGWNVSILGTDINLEFLAQARTGCYTNWALREVPEEIKASCFRQEGNRWLLNSEFRHAVQFRYHNLAEDSTTPAPDGLPFDLIFCRNVMIYFSPERIHSVADRFFDLLAEGGWLLVGHAELSIDTFHRFEFVRGPEMTAYRKPPDTQVPQGQPPSWEPWVSEEFVPGHTYAPALSAGVEVESPPQVSASVSVEDARIRADQGDWNGASAICRSVLGADPLNAQARFVLAMVLSHTQSAASAVAELRRAIYADRNFVLAYYYLGTLLQAGGNLPAARKAFRNTMHLLHERDPDEPLPSGDGITAAELKDLTRMHQEILGA